MLKLIITLALGFVFGSILIASQAFTWFRIQEMFHFQSFHMFGLLFSAIGTAALSIWILKKRKQKSIYGNPIQLTPKKLEWKANFFGGLIFGLGWAISGACSAPLYILVGVKPLLGLILFAGSLSGVLLYALLSNRLPK